MFGNIFAITGLVLFVLGLFGLIQFSHLLRKIIAINIAGVGVFMLFITSATRYPEPDPVPHALVLTGIVVAISATSLALALVSRIYSKTGKAEIPHPETDA